MAYYEDSESTSSLTWLLTGVVIGAVFGVLYAPRAGHEIRGEIGDYAREGGEKARGLVSRISEKIPSRVKAAAGFGEAKTNVKDRLS